LDDDYFYVLDFFILRCIYVEIYLGVGCIFMVIDMAIIEMYFEIPLRFLCWDIFHAWLLGDLFEDV